MYLTYEEYKTMGGTIDETAFNSLTFEVETIVNHLTFNRFKKDKQFPEELKQCIFKLMSVVDNQNKAISLDNPAIQSQSNDGVSISYNTLSASEAYLTSKKEINRIISMYLGDVKNQAGQLVLYRGLYKNE